VSQRPFETNWHPFFQKKILPSKANHHPFLHIKILPSKSYSHLFQRPIVLYPFTLRSYHQRPVIIHSFTWRQIKLCDDGGSVVGVGGLDVVEVLFANLRRQVVEVGGVTAVSAASNVGPHVPVAF
jgi:hypothetical protein